MTKGKRPGMLPSLVVVLTCSFALELDSPFSDAALSTPDQPSPFASANAFGRQQGAVDLLVDHAVIDGDSESTAKETGFPGIDAGSVPFVRYPWGKFHSWKTAFKFCATREGRLCTQSELCLRGKSKPPIFPAIEGEWYIAVKGEAGGNPCRSTNEWLNVGTFGELGRMTGDTHARLCQTHEQLYEGCPHWGLVDEVNVDDAMNKGDIFCCGDEKPRSHHCLRTYSDDEKAFRVLQITPPSPSKHTEKIFCMSYTHAKRHDRARAMVDGWMNKCDHHFFASDGADNQLPTIDMKHAGGEAYQNIWNKVRQMWLYAYNKVGRLQALKHSNDFKRLLFVFTNTDYCFVALFTLHLDPTTKHLTLYDWFYISGDDQFVIMSNLRQVSVVSQSPTAVFDN